MVAGISVRHFSAGVSVAGKNIGKCVTTEVAGEQHVYYRICQRLNITDDTRTATVENQHKRFACRRKSFYEIALIFRNSQVRQITRCLAVGVFTDAGHNDIGVSRRSHRLFNLRFVFLVIGAFGRISDSLFEHYIIITELIGQCLVDSVVFRGEAVSQMALP